MEPFFTIGHSTRSLDEFTVLLREAEVTEVVDVRKMPGSRRHPHFDEEVLVHALPQVGIRYGHMTELAGLRARTHDVTDDVNGFWDNRSFHNYADYALGEVFRGGLSRLRELGHHARTAVMCSEAVWWRCHRRIIADHLLAHSEDVFHILSAGRVDPAHLTDGAVVHHDGSVTYPATIP